MRESEGDGMREMWVVATFAKRAATHVLHCVQGCCPYFGASRSNASSSCSHNTSRLLPR